LRKLLSFVISYYIVIASVVVYIVFFNVNNSDNYNCGRQN